MKWFGRKSAGRDVSRPVLSRGFSYGAAGAWPQGYDAQVRDAYVNNPVAQRAVRLVAEGVASAPVNRSDAEALRLVTAKLAEAMAMQLLLHGNAFVQVLSDAAGTPVELFPLRPEPLGGGVWRLSELWRGRRGTEWATGDHVAGESFVLLELDAIARVPVDAAVGGLQVLAVGVGDASGIPAAGPATAGAATRPLSPVGLRATVAGGDVEIGWTRRSREGWRWAGMVDAPVAEERELYRVVKSAAGRADVVAEVSEPVWIYTSAERALDAGTATVTVVQVGSAGVSRTAAISISAI